VSLLSMTYPAELIREALIIPDHVEFARTITSVAISAYKKASGVSPRAVKVGNAAVIICHFHLRAFWVSRIVFVRPSILSRICMNFGRLR
jgi:hypothetical protein